MIDPIASYCEILSCCSCCSLWTVDPIRLIFNNQTYGRVEFYKISHIVFYPFTGNFWKFDCGLAGNIERYVEHNPPDYNLRKIRLPVYLHYATNDILANVRVSIALIPDFQLVSNFSIISSLSRFYRTSWSCTKRYPMIRNF